MSEAKGSQEPSMEEILASIRRIIAEDTETPAEEAAAEEPPPPAPAPAASPPVAPAPIMAARIEEPVIEEEEEVLELTEVYEEPPPVSAASFLRDPEPFRAPEPPKPLPPATNERLVSDAVAASSAAAFASITSRRRLPSDFPIGNGAATLEELTCALLRPMLKEWLDANLPSLVERLVQEEVQRLAREAL